MQIENHFPSNARHLITVGGNDLLKTLGLSALEQIVADVLNGVNVRNATEQLTKRRVGLLNGALLVTYASLHKSGIDPNDIPGLVHQRLTSKTVDRDDQIVLRWMLGLTQKQVQNVLRSNDAEWTDYIESLQEGLKETASISENMYGGIPISFSEGEVSWQWVLALLMAVGSQTLAIRGAEKSLYGKFFEKLVLAAVLSILGFRYVKPEAVLQRSFWLSTRGGKRESDATAIWNLGQGIRFDIGFIGSGNSEITLDKVSRFEKIIEMSGINHYMRTFIIVDRIGRGSRVPDLAKEINGTIIQMSANDWVKTLGHELANVLDDYDSPLTGMDHKQYEQAIREGVASAPLESILMSPQ